ncbi:MAG: cobalt/nickel transport system permease protein [Chloroflexi bacterium]|nr:MAG: cobalt/nickel transport system permease protein [Chloroflexota bacterium]MBA4375028.1 energy-coupling factor transporter transmembrane protein EcfT [Anaerolinea sp.]
MSEFDFLSRVTLGQYMPTGSILHRLDPRIKIISFTLLLMVLTFTTSKIGLGIGILVLLIGIVFSKVKLTYALKGLIPPLPFLLIIAALQVFFNAGVESSPILVSIGSVKVTMAGLWAGLTLLIRFTSLILCLSLASFCISTSEMIQGLQLLFKPLNRIKIHTMDLVMVIQVMLRFIPFLAQTAERIAKAQASRGAEWGVKTRGLWSRVRQIVPLILPLFLISLRRADNLALAMDARAYGYLEQRTSMHEFKVGWADIFFLLLNITVSLIILYV